jgi:hypothetical protein
MQKVTLKFKSASLLWSFKQAIRAAEVQVDPMQCTITCACSETEVSLAIEKYEARVIAE